MLFYDSWNHMYKNYTQDCLFHNTYTNLVFDLIELVLFDNIHL